MNKQDKIYVAGHQGLVGSALMRKLKYDGFENIVTREFKDLDLRDQKIVFEFFEKEKPDYVFLAAAKVGGIIANSIYPAEFLYDNLMISANVIHSAYLSSVKKLLYLGSSCIYPKYASQPMKEEDLLSGYLEKTNEPYAIAKIAGLKLCQSYNQQYGTKFISCMPTNLYGPNDNFNQESGHVIPALISKFCEAKKNNQQEVICWGTGNVYREFLHVDDFADAAIFLMNNYENYLENSWINVGSGQDIKIFDLVGLIKDITGFEGSIVFDKTKPDGTPKKLLDISKIKNLGWNSKITLEHGLEKVVDWYSSCENVWL